MAYQQNTQEINCCDSSLIINTLGNFSVYYDQNDITGSFNKSLKIWELFKYFITFRDELILPEKIIAAVWPEADYIDPKRTLRALIFRLRKALDVANKNKTNSLIVHTHGCYKFNTNCIIDAVEFEKTFHSAYAISRDNPVKAIELFEKVVEMYKGDYLSETYGYDWVIPARNYYRRIFLQSVYEASELLKEQKRYSEILSLCETAFKFELFEEDIHYRYIESLAGVGKLKQARDHYEYVTEISQREMGVKPSNALTRLYRVLFGEITKSGLDMKIVEDNLRDEYFSNGPVLCDKEIFKFLRQLEKRRAKRYGQSSFLVLLSITSPDHTLPPKKLLQEKMRELKHLLLTTLRKGDVITEWDDAQFVLSLPALDVQQANIALDRIQRKFKAGGKNSDLMLHHKVQDTLPN